MRLFVICALAAAAFMVASCERVPSREDTNTINAVIDSLPPECVVRSIDYIGGSNVTPTHKVRFTIDCRQVP